MKMGNWSLILVTSIHVGSGPSNSNSMVAAQCPIEEKEAERPSKFTHGSSLYGANRLYQQFPYLASIVPKNYKWWDSPRDIDPVIISFHIQDLDFWGDEKGFFHLYMKMTIMWEDFRLFTSNMTEESVDFPVDGGIWTPKMEANWIAEKTCSLQKTLEGFQNNSLALTHSFHVQRR